MRWDNILMVLLTALADGKITAAEALQLLVAIFDFPEEENESGRSEVGDLTL